MQKDNKLKTLIRIIGMMMFLWALWKKWQMVKVVLRDEWGIDVEGTIASWLKGKMSETGTDVESWIDDSVARGSDELAKIQTKITHVAPAKKKSASAFDLNDRQRDVYDFLKKNGEAPMAKIVDVVGAVSDRTVRRDMTKLERLGLVTQVGRTRDSVYKLKN